MTEDTAAIRGHPSYVWQSGQERRLQLIRRYAEPHGACILDIGCGAGTCSAQLESAGASAVGLEVDWPRAVAARQAGLSVAAAVGEELPFADGSFDIVLLHEVLEHVADDRASTREAVRVLGPGGRALVFAPNRFWPFETHGLMWRGRYRFGNIPLVNYLPDPLRNRVAPHVRVYTAGALRALVDGLPARIVAHDQVFPGYDKLAGRHPRLGQLLRRVSYALEGTPLGRFGLSHLMVIEKGGQGEDLRPPVERLT